MSVSVINVCIFLFLSVYLVYGQVTTIEVQPTIYSKLTFGARQHVNKHPMLVHQYWNDKMSDARRFDSKNVLYFQENIRPDYARFKNAYYSMFAYGYSNHVGVVLSPDDVWNAIVQQIVIYVGENSEQLCTKLFTSDFCTLQTTRGKQLMTVYVDHGFAYENFMEQIVSEINKLTVSDIVPLLLQNFTTTTDFERHLSYANVMASFQQYFEYEMDMICGIPRLRFQGTLEDWQLLRTKTQLILNYFGFNSSSTLSTMENAWPDEIYFNGTTTIPFAEEVDRNWDYWKPIIYGQKPELDMMAWANDLDRVLEHFILSYQGKPDLTFWNNIIDRHGSVACGESGTINGWITRLISRKNNIDVDGFPTSYVKIEFIQRHEFDDQNHHRILLAGFSGLALQVGQDSKNLSSAFLQVSKSIIIFNTDK